MTYTTGHPREWDAAGYDRLAAPMTMRGNDIVAGIPLGGGETVVDAGCGTGQVTAKLLERLPRGRVIAVDASEAMLERCRERLGGDPRVAFLRCDLGRGLPLTDRVDAIVSTSTLHWIGGHDRLFERFAAALAPGGRLAVDCGGDGNCATVLAALRELGYDENPWTFATVEETERDLAAAGFDAIDARLVARPAQIGADRIESYLRTVILGPFVDRLPDDEAQALVSAVAERLPGPAIDYVRLQFGARRAGGDAQDPR
jgi:trans-aconitate 2-methyltransferase